MHIFIYSHAPWAPSGYGTQVAGLSKHLTAAGHEVSIIAIEYHSTPLKFENYKVLPCRPGVLKSYYDLYYWAEKEKPDIIIQLFDAWVIGHTWIDKYNIPVICYNPVDSADICRNFKESCKNAKLHIAMSPHAKLAFDRKGITPNEYIPHCLNPIFQPTENSRKDLNIPADAFIFGLIGTNLTYRKNIPQQVLAFKNFLLRTHAKNAYLYIHSAFYETLTTSYSLDYLIESLDLKDRVMHTHQQKYLLNDITEAAMNKIYNSIDVLLCCSLGEGFGIPIIEAQACGKPVITTNASAMPYTAGAGALLCENLTPICDSGHMGWWAQPTVDEITEHMISIYEDKRLREQLSERAIENAKQYLWSDWINVWFKILQA